MLRNTTLFFIAFVFGFYSCDPCNNLDCLSSNYFGQFRIVSTSDGRDLVFGAGSRYNSKTIQFYSLNGNDTSYYDYKPLRFPGCGHVSILYVYFYPETNKPVYMKLSDTDTDTLHLTYNAFKSRCCGIITSIQSFQYNNEAVIENGKGTLVLKK